EIGLLPKAARRHGGHRLYGDADLKRLTFIRRCRDFGFPIDEVPKLAAPVDAPETHFVAARHRAPLHLDDVRRKLKELRALERSLKAFVIDCDAQCAGGPTADCLILEDLSKQPSCCGGPIASPPARRARKRPARADGSRPD